MTGFWIFMVIMALLIPAIMVVFGLVFRNHAPKTINSLYGYRTTRSMKNRETWEFAHRVCGRLWLRVGAVLAPVSLLSMLLCLGRDTNTAGVFGIVIVTVQTAVLIGSIFPVEAALKRTFDDNGFRRQP